MNPATGAVAGVDEVSVTVAAATGCIMFTVVQHYLFSTATVASATGSLVFVTDVVGGLAP